MYNCHHYTLQEVKSIVGRAYNKAESLLKENAEKLSKVHVRDVHSALSMELSVQLFSCMYCIARISVRHSGCVCVFWEELVTTSKL